MTDAQLAAFLSGGGGGTKTYGKSAYVLFYERKSKKNLIEHHKDKDTGEEKPVEVDFRSVEKFVPSWISELVAADNKSFIVDSTIFSDTFFDFVKNTFKQINTDLIMTQSAYPHLYSRHFDSMKEACLEISGKVLYDMLAHYDHNIMISDTCAAITTIITFTDSGMKVLDGEQAAMVKFLKKFVLDEREHFF